MNLYGIVNYGEYESVAHIKENDLQLRKKITLRRENDYLCKIHILNELTDYLYDYYSSYDTTK